MLTTASVPYECAAGLVAAALIRPAVQTSRRADAAGLGVQMKPVQLLAASCNLQADERGVALTTFGRFAGLVLQ